MTLSYAGPALSTLVLTDMDRGSGTKNVIFSNGPNFISECSNLL
jgi:hypothetical protein